MDYKRHNFSVTNCLYENISCLFRRGADKCWIFVRTIRVALMGTFLCTVIADSLIIFLVMKRKEYPMFFFCCDMFINVCESFIKDCFEMVILVEAIKKQTVFYQ